MTRPATADHLKSKKRPATKTVDVVLDPEAAAAVRDAEAALQIAESRSEATGEQEGLWAAQEAYEAVKAQAVADDVVVTLKFRSIGRHAYDELVRSCPPTEAQKAESPDVNVDIDRFPQALVAASLIEPKLPLVDVEAMWDSDDWNTAELAVLYAAALEVNNHRATVDLGKGSSRMPSTGPRSPGA